jgi:hypothetical protein
VRYLLADREGFIPLDDPEERFANGQRVGAGIGYRRSLNWRFEACISGPPRGMPDENFRTSDHIMNLRVMRVF